MNKIHEQMKKRGEWDGLPNMAGGQDLLCTMSKERRLNAYIAQKLDLITEAIVDAMRARREGKLVRDEHVLLCQHHIENPKHKWSYASFSNIYKDYAKDTFESNLALALIRVLDLMGFYGEPVNSKFIPWDEYCDGPRLDAISLSRWCVRHLSRSSIENGATHVLFGVVNSILRIAELDKIDIQWHLDARLKYESGVK